ncbi:MAG: nicotinate-nucleotide adenylyltransferase [Roseinatronobacter sp.]
MTVPPRHVLPFAPRRARIGLFGGSFDPAHAGHVHVSREALKRLHLDQVWWLVSPGNPLKPQAPASLRDRLSRARALIEDPRIKVTDLERHLCTRYSADTLQALTQRYPGRRFVWIMGADNLAGFHHWENWQRILALMPIAVMARPGVQRAALNSVVARAFRAARLPAAQAAHLPVCTPPAWCYLTLPLNPLSSTHLRARGLWPGQEVRVP